MGNYQVESGGKGMKEQRFKREVRGHILLKKIQGHALLWEESALGLNNLFFFFFFLREQSCLGSLGADLVSLNIVM